MSEYKDMSQKNKIIDNSALIPEYIPDSEVAVDFNGTPDWLKSAVIAQVRPLTATQEGTFASLEKVLRHYAEMGVNCIWLAPVYDPGKNGNGYSNLGPHTIDPRLTGTDDYDEGWARLRSFTVAAHKMNIRIILDIISWGTVLGSELEKEHPDWYIEDREWGGSAFDWKNAEFREWYIKTAVDIVVKTDCDGFRYDVEPHYAGYDVDGEIRKRLMALGKKPFMLSEWGNERRGAYDCEQMLVLGCEKGYRTEAPQLYFIDMYNIVDSIKTGKNIGSRYSNENGLCGTYRYYVNTVTCHDHMYPVVCGNRLALGYQAIFAPFIPLWYIGEEWNNPREGDLDKKGSVLYFNKIDWSALEIPENRKFFEDIKAMIRIRRSYPELFEYFPGNTRNTNICKVNSSGGGLQCYARFANNKAALIIPNNAPENSEEIITVDPDMRLMGLDPDKSYTLRDAETNEGLGCIKQGGTFKIRVPYRDLRVLILE